MALKNDLPSGANLDIGACCSAKAYNIAKRTFANREGLPGKLVTNADGLFSSAIDFNGQIIGISSDGIGTKIDVAERTNVYDTLGFDLLAMVADDLAAGGFVPTNISNIIDVDFPNPVIVEQLMEGLRRACGEANTAISGGEIAEIGRRVGGYGGGMHFNWGATAIGILHPALSTPIEGAALRPGDLVLALQSRGLRSNGFSLARRILEEHHGPSWHELVWEGATLGERLLTPSKIYAPAITGLLDAGILPHAVIHVTGGGVPDNLMRVLSPLKLGAELTELWPPHPIMDYLRTLGDISGQTAYRQWNMGNGMLVVVAEEDGVKALDSLSSASARLAGSITPNHEVRIGDFVFKGAGAVG